MKKNEMIPFGISYAISRPSGLLGVLQSIYGSFLKHLSISTELKKATD